jgi:toxin ParE1/3/4
VAFVAKRPLALADLAEIWSFIADDSEAQADRFLVRRETQLQLLATQPTMGRACDDLMAQARRFPFGRYAVFYFARPDGIELLRVLHSARDIQHEDFNLDSSSDLT